MYPPDFTYPLPKLVTAHRVALAIAEMVPARRSVVQAGGCAGLWPLALATHFAHVYTFEPAPDNFHYLHANVAAAPNISAFHSAVGDTRKGVGLTRPKAKAGLWRVEGDGEIPMVTIDDTVGDEPIDALVLDVEGSELAALRGAERVIATHRPLVWCEFLSHTEDIEAFLAAHGYARPWRFGADAYSVHASRLIVH